MNSALARRITAVFVVIAALLLASGLPATANADNLQPSRQGSYLTYWADGMHSYIGVIGRDGSGRNYYCIEAGAPASYVIGETTRIQDNDAARRIAWLMDHYQHSDDSLAHAAIGLLTHDRFDRNPSVWAVHRAIVTAEHVGVEARANELWQEAGRHAPADADIVSSYAEGIRKGRVEVTVRNAQGEVIVGVPYSITLAGPARFGDGQAVANGTSAASPSAHEWTATGTGDVSASVAYERRQLDRVDSAQAYARYGGASQTGGGAVSFSVRKDFTPTITTSTASKVVDSGGELADLVMSGVRGETSHWVPGLELVASGWYFDGLKTGQLGAGVSPNAGETASDFLARLDHLGYRPAAHASASFTGPGQTVRATAVTASDGGESYRARDSGGFGTWVWAFERSVMSQRAKEYVQADVVTPFLDVEESNVNRAKLRVESSVTEHSAAVDAELSDTITVSGFPDGHGAFPGDERFGFGADEPYAQVRVWWSGDIGNPDDDEQYRPSGRQEPQADEHHRLIGTWEYAASNGTIRVGAGAPDAHGKPVTITARDPGWYVFVWSFVGDDRVMPASSAYDDAWERTRVQRFAKEHAPAITTQVDPDKVAVGEFFVDTARITGALALGAYVEFTAYEPVGVDAVPGLNGTLLSAYRVETDHTATDQTVTSARVSAGEPGLVHWKATLFSAKGDVLATHRLGVPGEVVEVVEERKAVPALAQAGIAVVSVTAAGLLAAVAGAAMLVMRLRRANAKHDSNIRSQ